MTTRGEGEWPNVSLGQLALAIKDGTHGTHPRQSSGVPLLSAKNITAGGDVTWDESDSFISESEFRRIDREFKLRPRDLLLTVVGSLGRRALHDGSRVVFQRSVAFIRANPTRVIPDYLFHATGSADFQRQLRNRSNATAQAGLYLGELEKTTVPLPPRPEQHGIAEILDTLDQVIRKTDEVIAKLQQVKQGLLHDLLTRGIDENGELRDPERHPEQFRNSPLGRVPREWTVRLTPEVAAPEAGSTTIGPFGSNLVASDYRPTGVPVVFVRDVREEEFVWNSDTYVSPRKAATLRVHDVQAGDVLATKMGLPPCISAVYPTWMPSGLVTADIIRLRPNPKVARSEWIATYLNCNQVRRQVRAITGGVTRPKVTLADFRGISIGVPPIAEQNRILTVLKGVRARLDAEVDQVSKLSILKHGLMRDLLTGRVRVQVPQETTA